MISLIEDDAMLQFTFILFLCVSCSSAVNVVDYVTNYWLQRKPDIAVINLLILLIFKISLQSSKHANFFICCIYTKA